jgi:hypothetical protein
LPRIERFYAFLTRDYEEKQENESASKQVQVNEKKSIKAKFLNFEDFLNNPKLPVFLAQKQSYHVKYRFEDFHNGEQETIEEIVKKTDFTTWKR